MTDSAVVLGWLTHSTNNWRVFVSHRVVQIRNTLPHTRWRYVPSSDNPTDHASHGLTPSHIVNCEVWWHGPPWLCLPPAHWPAHLNPTKLQSLPKSVARVNIVSAPVDIASSTPPWQLFSLFRRQFEYCPGAKDLSSTVA